MNTGLIKDWGHNPLDIGPMYPFVGWEWLFVIFLVIFWIYWHYWQITLEESQIAESKRAIHAERNKYQERIHKRVIKSMEEET